MVATKSQVHSLKFSSGERCCGSSQEQDIILYILLKVDELSFFKKKTGSIGIHEQEENSKNTNRKTPVTKTTAKIDFKSDKSISWTELSYS